jgi:hypothetical protein
LKLPNRPLQRMIAAWFRAHAILCREGAGCARASSRPWYARTQPGGARR